MPLLVAALTDKSANVYPVDLTDAMARNRLASRLGNTTSLAEVEDITRRVCGFSEIDYERAKAKILRPLTRPTSHHELGGRLESYSRSAHHRGVRRMREMDRGTRRRWGGHSGRAERGPESITTTLSMKNE